MCGIAWLKENGCSEFLHVCFSEQHLDTHGSGGMGACMLRVSLRLVCPFTLIVSYLSMHIGHNKAQGGDERERDSNPISRLETSSGEMSLRPGCSCQATIITIKEEEHEDGDEDGDGAGGEGGSVLKKNVDSNEQHLPLDRSPIITITERLPIIGIIFLEKVIFKSNGNLPLVWSPETDSHIPMVRYHVLDIGHRKKYCRSIVGIAKTKAKCAYIYKELYKQG